MHKAQMVFSDRAAGATPAIHDETGVRSAVRLRHSFALYGSTPRRATIQHVTRYDLSTHRRDRLQQLYNTIIRTYYYKLTSGFGVREGRRSCDIYTTPHRTLSSSSHTVTPLMGRTTHWRGTTPSSTRQDVGRDDYQVDRPKTNSTRPRHRVDRTTTDSSKAARLTSRDHAPSRA
jgi:hypothetical protein